MMGAAGAGGAEKTYVEDVFSTWLYTGNVSTQTITNGVDLAGKGGLVWTKARTTNLGHALIDTVRGGSSRLITPNNLAADNPNSIAFASNGYTLTDGNGYTNGSNNYASWTFREAPGFFDVVTYTGNGSNRTIAHSLGSVPGAIIVKRTDAAGDWQVYHRSLANTEYMVLNSTAAKATGGTRWNSTTPTSTVFSLGTDETVNASGGTYVAYLFAHDAQLFGDGGNQSVIKCGSYTGNGSASGPTIDLGWEPQWVFIKCASRTSGGSTFGGSGIIMDSMRGIVAGTGTKTLAADETNAESTENNIDIELTPTGFKLTSDGLFGNASGGTYIYIAIRRGPMKAPTDATKVFDDVATSGATGTVITTGFPVDWQLCKDSRSGSNGVFSVSRLTGVSTVNSDVNGGFMRTSSTAAETQDTATRYWDNTGYRIAASQGSNDSIYWNFRRAPGFFDVVAYAGTGANPQVISHNLGVAPELIIIKNRSTSANWAVGSVYLPNAWNNPLSQILYLNLTNAAVQEGYIHSVNSSTFTQVGVTVVGANGNNYIAYLFASLTGISKVGSYTGTGTTLSIDCGFTAGARFVMIKRTDSTGDWYVWDTARGIIAANDPYLLLNATAAEVTNTDYIDPLSSGFQISSTAPAAINANGGSFIYLAIA